VRLIKKIQIFSMSWGHGGHLLLEKILSSFLEIKRLILKAWACWLIARDLQISIFYLFSNNCLFQDSLSSTMKEANFH